MFIKKFVLPLFLALALPVLASAHSVSLSATKSVDDTGATGSGYTTWRLSGSCPASVTTTAGFTALNSSLITASGSSVTYTDSTVTPGNYCYVMTFTLSSATSVPSNTAAASILPAAPTNVTITGEN